MDFFLGSLEWEVCTVYISRFGWLGGVDMLCIHPLNRSGLVVGRPCFLPWFDGMYGWMDGYDKTRQDICSLVRSSWAYNIDSTPASASALRALSPLCLRASFLTSDL